MLKQLITFPNKSNNYLYLLYNVFDFTISIMNMDNFDSSCMKFNYKLYKLGIEQNKTDREAILNKQPNVGSKVDVSKEIVLQDTI